LLRSAGYGGIVGMACPGRALVQFVVYGWSRVLRVWGVFWLLLDRGIMPHTRTFSFVFTYVVFVYVLCIKTAILSV